MFKEYCMLLLAAHLIGDFYMQDNTLEKGNNPKWVLTQCLSYWAVVLVISVPVMSKQVILFGSIFAITHTAINVSKLLCISSMSSLTPSIERSTFFADQVLHLVAIVFVAYLFVLNGNTLFINNIVKRFLATIGVSAISLLTWTVALLALHKPANTAVSQLLKLYKPKSQDDDAAQGNKAGRLIGTMERIIIVILISLRQYSAIGLVLTAKSIARYEKISKEPAFAEYYLIGTLSSVLAVITISLIL